MAPPSTSTPLSRWFQDLLGSRAVPVAGLVAAAAAAALYLGGWLAEGPAAAVLAVLVTAGLAIAMISPALAGTVDPLTRSGAVLIALAAGLLAALAALSSVVPGTPATQAEVSRKGDRVELPAGALGPTSRLRLLVHAPLPQGGTPVVDFRFTGGAAPLEGQVERTVSYARVGRGGRAAVAHDRNELWVHGAVGAGTTALALDRIDGAVAGPLHVSVYGEWLSPLLVWAISLGLLVLAAIWETRLRGSHFAALAGMALAYGLLVYGNATPGAAIGTSIGAVLLGALAGSLSGGLLAMLARLGPWNAPPPEAEKARGGKPKA